VQFAESRLEHAALGAARNEARRPLGRDAGWGGVEGSAQLVRIVGFDDAHDARAVAKRRDDRLGHFGCA
jgi:hypothetical protein